MKYIRNRSHFFLIRILFFLSPLLLISQSKNKSRNYFIEGNKNYYATFYKNASINYIRSIQEGENSYKTNFNLGNSLYKLKKYDDAIFHYESSIKLAISKNKIQLANAYYNIGNCYYNKKNYKSAVESYKKSLKQNPADDKARYNYALTLEKLAQEEERKYKENNLEKKEENSNPNKEDALASQDNSSNNAEKQKDTDANSGEKGGKGNENKEGTGAGNEKGTSKLSNLPPTNEQKDLEEYTPEQKEVLFNSILQATKEHEKKAQQKIINKKIPASKNEEGKDW